MKDGWEASRWVARDEPLEIGNEGGEVQMEAGIRESYLTKLWPDLRFFDLVESSGGPPCSIAIESRNKDNKLTGMIRVLACTSYKLNIVFAFAFTFVVAETLTETREVDWANLTPK